MPIHLQCILNSYVKLLIYQYFHQLPNKAKRNEARLIQDSRMDIKVHLMKEPLLKFKEKNIFH